MFQIGKTTNVDQLSIEKLREYHEKKNDKAFLKWNSYKKKGGGGNDRNRGRE